MSNEQQARRDAMADAETLLNVARDAYDREPRRAARAWRSLIHARVDLDFYEDAVERVPDCAHAAFRAVPALRGE